VWEAYINSENDDHQEEPLPFAAEDLVFSDAGDTSSAYSTNVGLLLAHQCETAPILRSFMESTAQTSEEDMVRLLLVPTQPRRLHVSLRTVSTRRPA
jgi:hypothetical protein